MQKTKIVLTLAVLLAVSPVSVCRAATPEPKVFCLSGAELVASKTRIAAGDPVLKPSLDKLCEEADRALTMAPVSVTENTLLPPSGNKHDYMSLAPYWWPDPTKKDGLPYIRKDGERNPDCNNLTKSDAPHFGQMGTAVETLSLAYYLTGKETYAVQAAKLLRAWFLDPDTRMNPNLNYGQAVRGRNDGRGTGIIETIRLTSVVDSVGMLSGSPSWTADDQKGMTDWMREYLNWLQTSPNGKDEGKAKNNHGTFYDVQVASLALFTGQKDLARRVLQDAEQGRIATQIKPDGSQPLELERTRSYGYVLMNTEGWGKMATLADHVGVDLWGFQTTDGRGIRKVLDYLLPYADPKKPWPFKQITHADRAGLLPVFEQAYLHYHDPAYLNAVRTLTSAADETAGNRSALLYPDSLAEAKR